MKRNKTQERLIQIMLNKNIKPKIFSDKFLLVTIDVFNDEGRFSNNEKEFVKSINDTQKIKFIFKEIISYLSDTQRKIFIKYIIDLDIKFETFKKLSLEDCSMSWSGSAVPMYQKRIDFFESLLELFEGVKYLEFKKYIEEIIEWKKVEIKREKKSDFVDNF